MIDVLVLGASGFTGAQVALHLARRVQAGKASALRWAIAGRSLEKLREKVQSELQQRGLPEPEETFVVDVTRDADLDNALSKCRLVLNCTGPYRFYGEPVVRAAIRNATDYADLCGEPEFMERMYLNYEDDARKAGVLILHACAFDSVPADLGCLFTAKRVAAQGLSCASVDSYLGLVAGAGICAHVTTYEAAVHGFGSVKELKQVRKMSREKYPPPVIPRVGSRPEPREGPFKPPSEIGPDAADLVAFKFPGADASVVRTTQTAMARRNERSGGGGNKLAQAELAALCPHYSAFVVVNGTWAAVLMGIFGTVFNLLARSEWGRSMLLRHPETFSNGMFTRKGPSEEQLQQTSFYMTYVGRGYRQQHGNDAGSNSNGGSERVDKQETTLVCRCTGPEPGYVATPLIFLDVADTILSERDSLAEPAGVRSAHAWGCLLGNKTLR